MFISKAELSELSKAPYTISGGLASVGVRRKIPRVGVGNACHDILGAPSCIKLN
ncbi:hypothetical protein [Planktothricoides raciborskii]|uniref:Uncharacterized protein n=1 Tax=Planktothricoides raciborskii FACHB-1370 TaxID=2949576 RepID=A0ABR8EDQ1_9CYAN|nr:hypothetical protein [Planktothricoides raciborskii]MBD2543840.1 hypothetical protein [Planktothricoides raciborskii FACHB-1370]